MQGKRILLVEDEKMMREGVRAFLKSKGYVVTEAEDGAQALMKFMYAGNETSRESQLEKEIKTTDGMQEFDLVILDVMLPKRNGFEVLREIRKKSEIPVLMLTALNDEGTQIASFDDRADDFLSKPFSLLILLKRIEALLRRNPKIGHLTSEFEIKEWRYEDVLVDFLGYKGYKDGVDVDLKPKEIDLLKLLILNSKKVLRREQILDELWKDELPYDRVVDVYIKNLRKKLGLNCIETVKGVGYCLINEKHEN